MGLRLFVRHHIFRQTPFRTLNFIDKSNREVLTIEVDLSLPVTVVVRVMKQLEEIVSMSNAIGLCNWSELRSEVFTSYCAEKGIEIKFIQPGKLDQKAFIEYFY
jgi:putative transposase